MKFQCIFVLGIPLVFSSCSAWLPAPKEREIATEPKPAVSKNVPDLSNPALKKRVLVLRFLNRSNYDSQELQTEAASDVRSALSNYPDITLVNDSDIDGSDAFSADDINYNFRAIFSKARANGIAGIVAGTIEDIVIEDKGDEVGLFRTRYHTASATLRLQVFDVSTEREVQSRQVVGEVSEEQIRFLNNRSPEAEEAGKAKSAVAKAVSLAIAQFPDAARRISWAGRIAKVELPRYYINAGEATGIERGQFLKVLGESISISDPETGTYLGMAPGRFKGLLKVVDFLGRDGAVAVLHSGGGFKESDRVEIFRPPQITK